MRRPTERAVALAGLLAALVLPLALGSDATTDALTNALTYAVLALGLNIVVGFTGLLDLGYAAFFAIGAYAYGILASFQLMPHWSAGFAPLAALGLVHRVPGDGAADLVRFTFSFWLMLPVTAGLAALCGAAFGAPTLRLRGDYLAIVTLGFGEIVPIAARNWTGLTNGAQGLNGIAAPRLFGFRFGIAALPYYYVALGLAVLLIVASRNLRGSRTGRAMLAIREDEIAAAAMGIDRARTKLLAFALGAACAGMAGTDYVAKLHTATPDMFGFPVSVMILVMVVLGGLGSVWGVVLGAVMLSLLQSWVLPGLSAWLHDLGRAPGLLWLQQIELAEASELIFGVILVAMMLFRRDGLLPAPVSPGRAAAPAPSPATPPRRWGGAGFGDATARPGQTALELRGLRVCFGGLVALNGLDLDVPAGAVMAVIGPNGSGKSTLFNAVTGFTAIQSGVVRLFGADVTGRAPHRLLEAGVARSFQNIRVFPNLSVLDNVLVGQHAHLHARLPQALLHPPSQRVEESQAAADAIDLLALFGAHLVARRHDRAGDLSYADRRRVEIARALAARPRLLLLDEPAAGMNPRESMELAEQLALLHARGLSLLLIEHKLDVVARLAGRVVVLANGEKLAEGSAEEVRRDPAVLDAYLGRAGLIEEMAGVG